MPRENQTIGELLRYVDSDFNSGLSYFKSGLNNILYTLMSGLASEIVVDSPITGYLLSELIENLFEGVEFQVCGRTYIVFTLKGQYISVICRDNKLKFQLTGGKSNKGQQNSK